MGIFSSSLKQINEATLQRQFVSKPGHLKLQGSSRIILACVRAESGWELWNVLGGEQKPSHMWNVLPCKHPWSISKGDLCRKGPEFLRLQSFARIS